MSAIKKIKNKPTPKKTNSSHIAVHMKMGILHTIAKSIYSGVQGKIREAVANAIDNRVDGSKASHFIIYIDRATRTISLFDDGTGISRDKFADIFSNLGLGLYKHEPEAVSYFGLGLMSVIRLGNSATIVSRSYDKKELLKLDIHVNKIFDEENEGKDISFIEECISMPEKCNASFRNANSPLSDNQIKGILGEMPSSFTELIIKDVPMSDIDVIASKDFQEDIRKVLPLRLRDKEPFLDSISDPEAQSEISNILNDDIYCPTISVFYGIEGEQDINELKKYFPSFKHDLSFEAPNALYGKSEDDQFKYYILFTTEDLEESNKANTETGFWVRSRNFLVKAADYFQRPGSKKKYINQPLKNWIYGEIFHKNMKSFLNVSRTDYVWDSDDFDHFRDSVVDLVADINKKLRKLWESAREVEKSIISPFLDISESSGPFYRATTTISNMGIDCEGEHAEKVLQNLGKARSIDLESLMPIDEMINNYGSSQIALADDESIKVVIDKNMSNDKLFYKSIEDVDGHARSIIRISPQLFAKRRILFLSKKFDLIFVSGTKNNKGISVNNQNSTIYVNPFNHDLMKYSVSFIDVYIAVELAHMLAKTKDEMKTYLLSLLGREYPSPEVIMSPLSDDLLRKKRGRK